IRIALTEFGPLPISQVWCHSCDTNALVEVFQNSTAAKAFSFCVWQPSERTLRSQLHPMRPPVCPARSLSGASACFTPFVVNSPRRISDVLHQHHPSPSRGSIYKGKHRVLAVLAGPERRVGQAKHARGPLWRRSGLLRDPPFSGN